MGRLVKPLGTIRVEGMHLNDAAIEAPKRRQADIISELREAIAPEVVDLLRRRGIKVFTPVYEQQQTWS